MPPDTPTREFGWFTRVAKKIVREGKNFLLACDELGIDLPSAREGQKIQESDGFQTTLRQERLRYGQEIASDPNFSKNAAIGLMYLAISRLADDGEWDKALEGWQKLAKLTGWQGADQQVTVFADLKGREIDELRQDIAKRLSTAGTKQVIN